MEFLRTVTEWVLPGLSCLCCGAVTFTEPPTGAHQGSVPYGPTLNAAADKAAARVSARLGRAKFDAAMLAALVAEETSWPPTRPR